MSEEPKVLLVDDDPGFLEANSILLRHAGYAVFTAQDGRTGLAAAQEHRPAVIVVDVVMNRPDEGFVLSRALRADPNLADAKILVVTAVGQRYQMLFEPDEQWLPVDKVLEKPATGDELLTEISSLLAGPNAETEGR